MGNRQRRQRRSNNPNHSGNHPNTFQTHGPPSPPSRRKPEPTGRQRYNNNHQRSQPYRTPQSYRRHWAYRRQVQEMLLKGSAVQGQLEALLDSIESLQREFHADMDWEPTMHPCFCVSEDEFLGSRTILPNEGMKAGTVLVADAGAAVVRWDGDEGGTGGTSSDEEMRDADQWILVESGRCGRIT